MRVRGEKCTKRRCPRPLYRHGMCKTHLKDECDRLFSLVIRARGKCESNRRDKDGNPVAHNGNLQCAHGFSRVYLKTRWNPDNAWCLCGGCHFWFTHHPEHWADWMLDRLGHEAYYALRAEAMDTTWKPDLELVFDDVSRLARERCVA